MMSDPLRHFDAERGGATLEDAVDLPVASLDWRNGIDRFAAHWRGRRIGVVGLARSGVAACRLLHAMGCDVRISELKTTDATRAQAQALREAGVERIELGDHHREFFADCEAMIVSPGVPESALPITWAEHDGVPILSEIEFAFRFCPSPIIAVTGTNGKSSVVTLIARVLTAAGKTAVTCGNIGIPFSSMIQTLTPESIVVLEVSSFQLLRCDRFRPEVGVLLNIGTNHLDRHPDFDSYAKAKARLFQSQLPTDYAVLNAGDPAIRRVASEIVSQPVWFGGAVDQNPARFRLAPATRELLADNLQAVVQVGRVRQIGDPLIYQAIREFRGLEHRLEHVATVSGVHIINDAKSTTPESSLYALGRCPGPVVVILGGKDKGLDFSMLRPALADPRVRGIVLIGQTRPALRAALDGLPVQEAESLDAALRVAMGCAASGETVLFSPACASFDMFTNFEERGRIFKTLVQQLQDQTKDHGPRTTDPCARSVDS